MIAADYRDEDRFAYQTSKQAEKYTKKPQKFPFVEHVEEMVMSRQIAN